jgi:RES domain-containing protein
MLPAAQIPAILASLPAAEFRGNLYRAIFPRYLATPTPISGIGAKLYGARFTPVGSYETIYFAEDPLTAFHEFHHINLQLIQDIDDPFAVRLAVFTLLPPRVVLEPIKVLDVTRPEIRTALGTSLNEITGAWQVPPVPGPPPTHLLGEETYNSGLFQAIRYPSARRAGGYCLAVFPDRLTPSGSIDLDDSRYGGPVHHIP